MEPGTGRRAAENKAARRPMETVWHGELFSDCCPTFSVNSVHRSHKASRGIQRESSVLGTPNKVKVRILNNNIYNSSTKLKFPRFAATSWFSGYVRFSHSARSLPSLLYCSHSSRLQNGTFVHNATLSQ